MLKKKAKLCLTLSFIGSGPQKTEGVGKLCCNSIWLLCGSLCSLKGKEDTFSLSSSQAALPGSHLPNYHPYKEAKRPLTRAGLSPLRWFSSQCLFNVRAVTLHLSASPRRIFLLLAQPSPSLPPSLSYLSTRSITNRFSTRIIPPVLLTASPCCPDVKR